MFTEELKAAEQTNSSERADSETDVEKFKAPSQMSQNVAPGDQQK